MSSFHYLYLLSLSSIQLQPILGVNPGLEYSNEVYEKSTVVHGGFNRVPGGFQVSKMTRGIMTVPTSRSPKWNRKNKKMILVKRFLSCCRGETKLTTVEFGADNAWIMQLTRPENSEDDIAMWLESCGSSDNKMDGKLSSQLSAMPSFQRLVELATEPASTTKKKPEQFSYQLDLVWTQVEEFIPKVKTDEYYRTLLGNFVAVLAKVARADYKVSGPEPDAWTQSVRDIIIRKDILTCLIKRLEDQRNNRNCQRILKLATPLAKIITIPD